MSKMRVCPKCRTQLAEWCLACSCGYVTSREQIDKEKRDKEELEQPHLALVREKYEFEEREKHRLAQQKIREQQSIERLASLEKQKKDIKNHLQKRLAELKVLLDQTILTEEEHNKRRQPVLDKYFELDEKIAREIESIGMTMGMEPLSDNRILPSTDTSRNDSFQAEVDFTEDPPSPPSEVIPKTHTHRELDSTTNIPSPIVSPVDSQKKGVGGWLAFLIAGMLVLGPCLSIGRLHGDFVTTEKQYTALTENDIWNQYKRTTWTVTIAFLAYMAISGWMLYTKHSPSSVTNAKIALWTCGPLSAVILGVLIPYQYFGDKGVDYAETIGAMIASLIVVSIWTAYLSKSKRVKSTYTL